jgi:hypothetical protein
MSTEKLQGSLSAKLGVSGVAQIPILALANNRNVVALPRYRRHRLRPHRSHARFSKQIKLVLIGALNAVQF